MGSSRSVWPSTALATFVNESVQILTCTNKNATINVVGSHSGPTASTSDVAGRYIFEARNDTIGVVPEPGAPAPLHSFLYRAENQSKENNMRVPRIITVFVCILFATGFAFAHKVRVDYDHSVNFSKYKTFMWVEKPQTENPLVGDRIVD